MKNKNRSNLQIRRWTLQLWASEANESIYVATNYLFWFTGIFLITVEKNLFTLENNSCQCTNKGGQSTTSGKCA